MERNHEGATTGRTLRARAANAVGEVSGAFGDLGTLLPYVVPVLVAGVLAPGPVFAGFAAGYLLVALVYRVPVAVQPMKALGAVILAGGLGAEGIAVSGAVLGALLLALAATPLVSRAATAIPRSVVTGLQLGLGLALAALAFRAVMTDVAVGAAALALLALAFLVPRGPWVLLVLPLGLAFPAGEVAAISPAPPGSLVEAVLSGVVPQLPLTLVNAVVVAAAVSHALYGPAASRVSERRLAATSGALNLVLAPLGALPMCHGAGGIAAHHRYGARGVAAPLVMALACAVAALQGEAIVGLLGAINPAAVGALLFYAGAELAFSRRLFEARPDCRPVIAVTAGASLVLGPAVALLAGLAAEAARSHLARDRRRTGPPSL
ncbi:putative sulfate/molybdate transporter [Acuticoccus sp. I52.16.1]|uniref:putative sulfate/molybdate transporter n=1 Tax=Acuticoccus sp. I52.16.1 TaxID=2928472 RepID=UPI001FD36969|nr:putative sulfate/molybdate transporter [Acuticoccus sp. I52.16.1]UOM35740.1 putative sulfate/molybdate transporter [Acuticoccus sp. I52.16.1]